MSAFFSAFSLVFFKVLILKSELKKPYIILEITPPHNSEQSPLSTEQLFSTIYSLGRSVSLWDGILGRKKRYSLEILATATDGIRFLLRASKKDTEIIKKNIISYSPDARVQELEDFLDKQPSFLTEMQLSNHFAFPLQHQTTLKEHDPIAYLTGHMTKLGKDEAISLQIVITPVINKSHRREMNIINRINKRILHGSDILPDLKNSHLFAKILIAISLLLSCVFLYFFILPSTYKLYVDVGLILLAILLAQRLQHVNVKKERELSHEQKELQEEIATKLGSGLFEASIRVYFWGEKANMNNRISGLLSSLTSSTQTKYQLLRAKRKLPLISKIPLLKRYSFFLLKNRLESMKNNPILSITEIASIYHFPYTSTTKTEDLIKSHSKQLPAPLSLKKAKDLDSLFAKNSYGGNTTMIGLNEEERRRHVYILGATGTGKSTLLLSMVTNDIQKGKGLCVIDPHGDLIEKILPIIPDDRIKDVIYFNPDDITYPIGLNLLELTPNLSEDDSLREKEFITESIISLFHKLYPEKYSGPRMEYILRNTIYTAFTTENPTLFTIYKLLINSIYRKSVVSKITDENLMEFWKYEFNKAGDYQKVQMISPITNKIGRFLFSPTAKRILEQEKSSINFDKIMDEGKILLCNLSKGKLGEDTSEVFGILIMTKIQLAALKRARTDFKDRKDFYLYVDEFQNFATPSFAQILSEARKYRLNAILAHQTTSQLEDKALVNITLANTGTIICFRTANPEDEKLILPQFTPSIQQGEIANLPSFHFYMKISALNPEVPFSGETIPSGDVLDKEKVSEIIQSSRENYATLYQINKEEASVVRKKKRTSKEKLTAEIKPLNPLP